MNAKVAREIFAGRSNVAWKDGEPGDAFLTFSDDGFGTWAIWKYLDGELLRVAHSLGYSGSVVSMILTGDRLNPPHTGKTDDNDLPYAMRRSSDSLFENVEWFYLGQL